MDESTECEKIGSSEPLTIDDAKKLLRLSGEKEKSFEQDVINKQDLLFKDIYCTPFGWKLQEDGSKKLVAKLPNGKILFPDRSENIEEIDPGVPYICLVYERDKEAFAKLICEEHQAKIFIPPSKIPLMVYREPNGKIKRKPPMGNTYEERIISAIKEMENLGFPSVKVIYRKNQR